MGLFTKISNGIDRLVGLFSPRLEYQRRGARVFVARQRAEQYAAAKTFRPGGDWLPVSANINDVLRGSITTVRARVRQLVRDFPYFARAVNSLTDHTVGQGILLQARINDAAGKLQRKLNQRLEDVFAYWADDCDVAGRLHFYELMQLAKRQDLEAGEFLLVKVTPAPSSRAYLPYQLQAFEADWLESDTTKWSSQAVVSKNRLDQGIEYETETGRVVAYHFTDPDGWGASKRVPAENVIHGFSTLRPGQLRGISPFTAGVLVAKDLSAYLDAEIDGAKLAAKYLAFVKSLSPWERQQALTDTDDSGDKIENMENAIIEYLRPGEEITIAKHDRPGTAFEPFTRLVLQMVSVSTGCPYEILSGDYKGLNYNTTRTSRNDFILQLRPIVRRHVNHFCLKTIEPFLNFAVLTGRLALPGYFADPRRYLGSIFWQPPGMEAIDPLRESKARIEEIKAGIRSPQEIVAARGRDLEEVLKEIAEFKALAEDMGLADLVNQLMGDKISTAAANNPAAVDPDTAEESDRANSRGSKPKVIYNSGGNMRKKQSKNMKRDAVSNNLNYRKLEIPINKTGYPATLDEKARSVEVIGLTEDPVEVFDWERGEVINEVLRMDGVELPRARQVPLLDSHYRGDTKSVIGSFRELSIEGSQLVGRVYFSTAPEAEGPFVKLREGHLTDFSGGYRPIESVWVPADQRQTIKGRSYKGPVMVRTRWRLKELSIVPIGADEGAKARANNNDNKKGAKKMDPRLRKYLERLGLPESATEDQAWRFFERLDDQAENDNNGRNGAGHDGGRAGQQGQGLDDGSGAGSRAAENNGGQNIDVNEMVKREAEKERLRVREIEALKVRFKLPNEMVTNMINEGMSVENIRKTVLDYVTASATVKGGVGYRSPVEVTQDERDKWRAAATDGMIIRAGLDVRGWIPDKPALGADETSGFTLLELARQSLRVAGQPIRGHIMEVIGRAFTSSDFPYILADVANKSLFAGYEAAEETWSIWCGTGSVSDFKTHNLPRLSEADDLDEIPEHGEYKYGKFTEAREQYYISTYGKLFAVTRQTIINDDLQALTEIPKAHGEAAARKVGDVAYAVLTGNAAMGDGNALFSTNHSNYVANGSGAAPGADTWAACILAMGTQKDLQGKKRLNLRPRFFIGPRALEGGTEKFFRSEYYSDEGTIGTPDASQGTTRKNIYYESGIVRVYDSRLDDNDAAAWFAAGQKGKTITVFFLNGVQRPYLETRDGWKVDGVEYKVRMDAGAKAVDWRSLYMNDGN